MEENLFLQTEDLVKNFSGIMALNKINLKIYKGQIQGLIGENGSGKSTVSSVISGIYTATSGNMLLEGKPYAPQNPLYARKSHIAMIVQETGTINGLSIADNLFLGDEARFMKYGYVNKGEMLSEAKKALEQVNLGNLDATAPIDTLNFETRKLVEIARALYYNPELLIVDETTTALSYEGRNLIHKIMRSLKEKNKAVLFISHDLPEVMEICDSLTVLRDGKLIKKFKKEEFDERQIKQTMVGRTIADNYYRGDFDGSCGENLMMQVSNVETVTLKGISLDLHEGEILGIGGLSGSGMHEIGKVMYGMVRPTHGEVKVFSRQQDCQSDVESLVKNVQTAMKNRIGYVSKDRDRETLLSNASIKTNLVISALEQLKTKFLIFPRAEKNFAEKLIESLNIKCSGMDQKVGELSGGNKQKVSFGKWIGNNSKILILDSPTRGVDVGVKATMYQLIYQLKKQGCAILIISEELPELIGMSDRVIIMKGGHISMEFNRSPKLTESTIIEYMI